MEKTILICCVLYFYTVTIAVIQASTTAAPVASSITTALSEASTNSVGVTETSTNSVGVTETSANSVGVTETSANTVSVDVSSSATELSGNFSATTALNNVTSAGDAAVTTYNTTMSTAAPNGTVTTDKQDFGTMIFGQTFSVTSFIGGIVLSLGIVAIAFFSCKFFQKQRDYQSL